MVRNVDEPVIGTWGDPPAYTKETSKVGGFWTKSGVIVFAIVIILLIGEVFLATSLPNCLLSEEFDNESVCAGAGISLIKWFLGSAMSMIFISFMTKYAVNFIRSYPSLRCPGSSERCSF